MIDVASPSLLWEVLPLGKWSWIIQGSRLSKPWGPGQYTLFLFLFASVPADSRYLPLVTALLPDDGLCVTYKPDKLSAFQVILVIALIIAKDCQLNQKSGAG